MQEEIADIMTELIAFLKFEPHVYPNSMIAYRIETATRSGDRKALAMWRSRQLIAELRKNLAVLAAED